MTQILCSELKTELVQGVTFTKGTTIEAIYPFIVMFNSPVGLFTLELKSGSTTIASFSFTSADLKARLNTTNDYLYSFHPLIPVNPIKIKKGTYNLRLSSSGYSYSDASFIAWGQQHEDRQNKVTYTITNSSEIPLAFRIKTKKEVLF